MSGRDMGHFPSAVAVARRISARAYERKGSFTLLVLVIFGATLFVLAQRGLVPDPVKPPPPQPTVLLSASPLVAAAAIASPISASEFPERIEIPAISLVATVANPDTTDVDLLDAALLGGAVRYPTSARLGEDGNVVLFGHSSYLPIVRNPAYKTFDGIQKLKPGENITVYSSHTAYVYIVKSVAKESANDGAIPLIVVGKELTLVTCNSFKQKTDRFVVVADFVESHLVTGS